MVGAGGVLSSSRAGMEGAATPSPLPSETKGPGEGAVARAGGTSQFHIKFTYIIATLNPHTAGLAVTSRGAGGLPRWAGQSAV